MAPRRPVEAFVDESVRGRRYLLACACIEVRHLTVVRERLGELVLADRQRIHFVKESVKRRRDLIAALNALPQRTIVCVAEVGPGRTEHDARASCLTWLVRELQRRRVDRLVLESRHSMDADDARTIAASRRPSPRLVFEHRSPAAEPLLWLPDAYAWAMGAGGEWVRRARAGVELVRTIGP